jgi:hypothetical protein
LDEINESNDLNKSHEDKLNSIFHDETTDGLLNEELIENTPGIDKSPCNNDKRYSTPKKSPTLSSYLKPSQSRSDEVNNKSSSDEENFNIENSLRVIGFSIDSEYLIIDANFKERNNVAIFKFNNKALVEKYGCEIMITPLKAKFNSFKEKMAVNTDLDEIRQVYVNFVYFPYDFNLLELLK